MIHESSCSQHRNSEQTPVAQSSGDILRKSCVLLNRLIRPEVGKDGKNGDSNK